jgi:hypothetical protein
VISDGDLQTYTVVGLIDRDTGEFLTAGVFAGRLANVDNDNDTVGFERCTFVVEANSWKAARKRALAEAGTDELFVDQLEAGHVLRYDDGATAEVDRVKSDGDDVIVRFPDGDEAVFDASALVRVIV